MTTPTTIGMLPIDQIVGLQRVRTGDRAIIAGNHTWYAAKRLGWTHIAAVTVDDDTETSHAFALADNRTGEIGTYDDALLLELLEEINATEPELLELIGWTARDIALIDARVNAATDNPPPDEAPPVPADPVSQPGDVWILGPHRVTCGDSTAPATYARLLGDERADCVWTDPPYGVDYVGKTDQALTIKNDGAVGLPALLAGAFTALTTAAAPGAAIYIAHPAGPLSVVFALAFQAAGWSLRQTLVWDKGTLALGHSDYHYRHEPILYGYTSGGKGRRGRGGLGWFGDNAQVSVLCVPKPKANRDHPTMKPVELITICLANSTPIDGLVLDPFGGSGSTLMACEQLGRRGRLIELDPRYVDVICRRWQEHTGQPVILEATGEPYDFTAPGVPDPDTLPAP